MSVNVGILLVSIIFGTIGINAQILSSKKPVPLNRRSLEHEVLGKCLTVSQNFELILETCNYNSQTPSVAGIFQVVKGNQGGHLMKWATRPKPYGIEGCLHIQPEEIVQTPDKDTDDTDSDNDAKADESAGGADELKRSLTLAECDPRGTTLSWEFVKAYYGKYLIRKYPDGLCVAASSEIQKPYAVPCNVDDPAQQWRICHDLEKGKKCDV